jgi:cytochrome c-type biogenesis protein CcmF
MIPELGNFALILALLLSLAQALIPLPGAARGDPAMMRVATTAARGQSLMLVVAMVCLGQAFVSNDFSVEFVAAHSNSALPTAYRVAAIWGGHEGSLLLWAFLLSAWSVALTFAGTALPQPFRARVLAVMGLVGAGFLLFMLTTSNPFARLLPAAVEGADLNPLLQDPGLVFHPPMLYMGYVGFSVTYGFAMAGLLEGLFDAAWARWARPWALAAWTFLTLGIGLGSFWAYYELGWGGWWFWDPVENASFMPWLTGTALIHSLIVTERRGAFRHWTVLLAITAFALSLLGTFLVRSGVLTSVHAFATDPARGLFILAFLGVAIGVSLLLYALHADRLGGGGRFEMVSRESLLLANNVLLTVAMLTVMIGTLYPLVLDALNLGKISVGPPYYKAVFVPLMAPVIFLMGIGPLARWRQALLPELKVRLRWAFVTGAIAAALPWALGGGTPFVSLGVLMGAWLASALVVDLIRQARQADAARPLRGLARLPARYYGMFLAHLGIAVFTFGATISGGYSVETDRVLSYGETVVLGGYEFRFDGVTEVPGPNYRAIEGTVTVRRDGEQVAVLKPQERSYPTQARTMTEAAIDPGFARHLYVALGEQVGDRRWTVRLYCKPLVQWIWTGVLMIGLGGVIAAAAQRRSAATVRDAVLAVPAMIPVPDART